MKNKGEGEGKAMAGNECWIVKNGGRYYHFMGGGKVYYTDEITVANRFSSETSAEWMAKRLGGEAVRCLITGGKLQEQRSKT